MLLNVCVVALLMFVGGLLLLARKKISSLCFVLALILGIAFSLSQMKRFGCASAYPADVQRICTGVWYLGVQPAIAHDRLFFR